MRSRVTLMMAATGASHPSQITTRSLLAWITAVRANNSVRARLGAARMFLAWCQQIGAIEANPCDHLPPLTKRYPTTYGKAQAPNPARFLSHDDAFGRLVATCQDGTDIGLRDEILLRLGLSGLRDHEISQLPVSAIRSLPAVQWTGKGHRPRTITAGPTLCELLGRWVELRRLHGASDSRDAHLFVPLRQGRGPSRLDWKSDSGLGYGTLRRTVIRRAEAAGLGLVNPHDLRRTAASILHHAKSADGGHRFDLLDIQRVLGHADPVTTMRSYLEPLDRDVLEAASDVLD